MSSLSSALNIATSALNTEQSAINVTGNNIANVGNANYSREVAETSPGLDTQIEPGLFVGTGVDLTGIQRQVDQALNSRLTNANSDASSASTTETWVGQIQSSLNALSGSDLSTQMSTFFTGWSNLANDPTDTGQRQVVIQNGENLASYVQSLNTQLNGLQTSVNQELPQQTTTANGLASQIASLNVQIVTAEGANTGTANALLDQRDTDISQLSQLVNLTTADQPDGSVNVYVGSEPLVEGQTNHGLSIANVNSSSGSATPTVVFTDTGGTVPVTSGSIGALEGVRSQIASTTASINTIARNLISSVNQLSSSGQGTEGFTTVTSTNEINDPAAALNSAAAGLSQTPTNGSFVVSVTQADGTSKSTLVNVNLSGNGAQTSLNALATTLNGIAGVSAAVANGQLTIKSTNGSSQISFSQDSSGTLAALGVNTFISGSDAADIAVNSAVATAPSLLAAAQNGEAGDNSNALAISQLESQSLVGLGGESLSSSYQNLVTQVANSAATAKSNATATTTVQQTLADQQQSVSGVSINDETVNLLKQQQAFQAAAQVVTTVNAMYATLLASVASAA